MTNSGLRMMTNLDLRLATTSHLVEEELKNDAAIKIKTKIKRNRVAFHFI